MSYICMWVHIHTLSYGTKIIVACCMISELHRVVHSIIIIWHLKCSNGIIFILQKIVAVNSSVGSFGSGDFNGTYTCLFRHVWNCKVCVHVKSCNR